MDAGGCGPWSALTQATQPLVTGPNCDGSGDDDGALFIHTFDSAEMKLAKSYGDSTLLSRSLQAKEPDDCRVPSSNPNSNSSSARELVNPVKQ